MSKNKKEETREKWDSRKIKLKKYRKYDMREKWVNEYRKKIKTNMSGGMIKERRGEKWINNDKKGKINEIWHEREKMSEWIEKGKRKRWVEE